MSSSRRALCFVAALGMAACVPDFDTDLSRLTEPRLLAIASSPAEARAQQPVTLSALVAAPEGTQAPPVDWTMCLSRKPLTELSPVNAACLQRDDGSGNVLDLGRGLSVDATLDRDACKWFGPLRPSPLGGEGAGRPVDPDITGGFYQPFAAHLDGVVSLGAVRIDCDPANVDRESAVAYRTRYRVNENPRISGVSRVSDTALQTLAEDVALSLPPGSRTRLRVAWDECSSESTCGDGLCTAGEDQTTCGEDCSGAPRGCSGAEPYVWYDQETKRVEPRREGMAIAWYASRGRFENEQTGVDEAQAASTSHSDNIYIASAETGPATVWIVIRDTRGGQSWQIRRLDIRP